MAEVLKLFTSDPIRAIAICAIFVATYFILAFKKNLEKQFKSFETQMDDWTGTIKKHMTDTRSELKTHSENLGKATKAINGDMNTIERSVFNLKKDVLERTAQLQQFAVELESETQKLSQVFATNVDRFELKLGQIVELKKELATAYGKIERLEGTTGELRILIGKHKDHLKAAGKILKHHQSQLDALKRREK